MCVWGGEVFLGVIASMRACYVYVCVKENDDNNDGVDSCGGAAAAACWCCTITISKYSLMAEMDLVQYHV